MRGTEIVVSTNQPAVAPASQCDPAADHNEESGSDIPLLELSPRNERTLPLYLSSVAVQSTSHLKPLAARLLLHAVHISR